MSNDFGPPPGHPHYMSDEDRARVHQIAYPSATAAARAPEKGFTMSTAAAKKYSELRKKIADAKKVMEETAKGLFSEMATDLFDQNSALMSFQWTQYTPYYCDGDVCEFSCNGDYPTVSMMVDGDLLGYDSNSGEFTVNGHEEESVDSLQRSFKSLGVDEYKKNGRTYAFDKKTNKVTVDGQKVKTYDERRTMFEGLEKTVGSFMRNFEDEDMETMFGDHVQVTVKRDGTINVEEYQHD